MGVLSHSRGIQRKDGGDSVLKILKTTSDSHTGHIAVTCCVVEKDGNSTTLGAEETHGIAADKLKAAHGGDVKLWLGSIHREAIERHEARKIAANAIQQLKEIQFIED
jgi:hypothetical protein